MSFHAETPYPDITLEEVLRNRFLVVHELAEILVEMQSG